MAEKGLYTIKAVAVETGLSVHTIRAWENRYQVIHPNRSAANQRRYTWQEVQMLRFLKMAVDRGHSIGQVAPFETDELVRLINFRDEAVVVNAANLIRYEDLFELSRSLDAFALQQTLARQLTELGLFRFLAEVVSPLLAMIGEQWQQGKIRVYQEHFLTTAVRTILLQYIKNRPDETSYPRMVVSTPPGQYHEIGALMNAAMAYSLGWEVLYLGPSLPVERSFFMPLSSLAPVLSL